MFNNLKRIIKEYNGTPFACAKYLFYFILLARVEVFMTPYLEPSASLLRTVEVVFLLCVSFTCILKFSQTLIIDYRRWSAGTLKLTTERVVINVMFFVLIYLFTRV